jgi:hypothetical protein
MMVNSRGVELTSIVSVAIMLVGAGTGDLTWKDHDQRGWKLQNLGVGMMDRILAYELIGTDPIGCLWDKAKYLDHIKRRAFPVESTEFKDTRIQVYGDTAVQTGLIESTINAKYPPYVEKRGFVITRLTRTWIRRHETWQCVAYQCTVVGSGELEPGAHHSASETHTGGRGLIQGEARGTTG